MKLKELASIRSGLVLARKQAKNGGHYQYPLITLRAVRDDGTLAAPEEVYNTDEPLAQEYLSQTDDLIMRLTMPYTVVLITAQQAGMVISSNFVVMRCWEDRVMPAYLHWVLNMERMKRRFYKEAAGNVLSAVSTRILVETEIPVPPLDLQRQAADIYRLARREADLLRRLADEKLSYYDALLARMYQKGDSIHDHQK